MKLWKNSECINKWYHRFVIVAQTPQGTWEQCQICHKRKFFKILHGKHNNMEYLSWHIRQALQPYHQKFNREYNKNV